MILSSKRSKRVWPLATITVSKCRRGRAAPRSRSRRRRSTAPCCSCRCGGCQTRGRRVALLIRQLVASSAPSARSRSPFFSRLKRPSSPARSSGLSPPGNHASTISLGVAGPVGSASGRIAMNSHDASVRHNLADDSSRIVAEPVFQVKSRCDPLSASNLTLYEVLKGRHRRHHGSGQQRVADYRYAFLDAKMIGDGDRILCPPSLVPWSIHEKRPCFAWSRIPSLLSKQDNRLRRIRFVTQCAMLVIERFGVQATFRVSLCSTRAKAKARGQGG